MAIGAGATGTSSMSGLEIDENSSVRFINKACRISYSNEIDATSYDLILKLRVNVQELTDLVDRLSFVTREIRYLIK